MKSAQKHGILTDELREEEAAAENKRKRMENLLTVRMPMDCVNYIIEFMDPTVRFEIDWLLTQDKIERIEVILSMMESEEILKHMNNGRLHFIIDESEDRDGYYLESKQFYNEQTLLRKTYESHECFRAFDYYRQKFYEAICEINQDKNAILYNNKNKWFYDFLCNQNYSEDAAIEQYKKQRMSKQLRLAFEFMHDRSEPVEVHQKLEKMLNVFMRLPKKFYPLKK